MKLVKSSSNQLVFQVGRREKDLLLMLLRLYPCIPPGHRKLSKTGKVGQSDQALLEEALAEQRKENRKRVHELMSSPARWAGAEHGWRLSLAAGEVDWLLQVLNDIRVGSWVLLGSPEHDLHVLNEKTAPHVWAMEMAGTFEVALLQALERGG